MKKAVVIIIILTIMSKIVGFSRDIVLAYYYGTSYISDAFLIALTIPMVVFSFIGNGISTAYIPMYSKIEQTSGRNEADRYTSNLIGIIMILCTIIFFFGFIYANDIIKLFASGFYGETLELAIKFTRVTLITVYFSALIYLFSSFLQMKEKFALPALLGLPLNLIMMIAIYLSVRTNIMILAYFYVVATFIQFLILVPLVYKQGYRYKFTLNIRDRYISSTVRIVIPIILGVSVNQINVLIDRTLASRIAIGGISSLTYANRLNGFIVSVAVLSVVTVLYPTISKMATQKNMNGLKKAIAEALGSIGVIVIPATIGATIFSREIVTILFGRGEFSESAINMTSQALLYYSIGMIGYSYREVVAKTFYSLQDTKTPMINAVLMVLINIVLNLILSKVLGIGGLALASSISNILGMGLLLISLRMKIGSFGMKKICTSFFKILFSSLLMGLVAKVSFRLLCNNLSQNTSLIFSVVIGALVYFIVIYYMKIEDFDLVMKSIKNRLKSREIK